MILKLLLLKMANQLNESVKRMNATTGWGSITITDHHREEDDNND